MPSVAIRRSAMAQLGYFDEAFKLTAADSDLVQRALLSFDAAFEPEVVAGYRVWRGSATRSTQATQGWLDEIDRWGAKVEDLMRGTARYAGEARRVRAELHATNLLAGLHLLRSHGEFDACRAHFRRSRYPFGARWMTQLRLLYIAARVFLR